MIFLILIVGDEFYCCSLFVNFQIILKGAAALSVFLSAHTHRAAQHSDTKKAENQQARQHTHGSRERENRRKAQSVTDRTHI